jgi:hypothetical protein
MTEIRRQGTENRRKKRKAEIGEQGTAIFAFEYL